jgi:hypothetical protein
MPDVLMEALSLFFPVGTLDWFDLISVIKTDTTMDVILEEKNIPPITERERGRHVESKGFKDITVQDFPIRGRKTTLTFRRRYWQVEGLPGLLKRDIKLMWDGTHLEKEFASFLKA